MYVIIKGYDEQDEVGRIVSTGMAERVAELCKREGYKHIIVFANNKEELGTIVYEYIDPTTVFVPVMCNDLADNLVLNKIVHAASFAKQTTASILGASSDVVPISRNKLWTKLIATREGIAIADDFDNTPFSDGYIVKPITGRNSLGVRPSKIRVQTDTEFSEPFLKGLEVFVSSAGNKTLKPVWLYKGKNKFLSHQIKEQVKLNPGSVDIKYSFDGPDLYDLLADVDSRVRKALGFGNTISRNDYIVLNPLAENPTVVLLEVNSRPELDADSIYHKALMEDPNGAQLFLDSHYKVIHEHFIY